MAATVEAMHTTSLPDALAGRVFSRADAVAHGLSTRTLRGPRVITVWPGRYRYADAQLGDRAIIDACRAIAPPDAALSHTSALALRGLALRPLLPVHLATNTGQHVRRRHIVVHRFQGTIDPELVNDVPVLGARRTFVDCGTILTLPELVAVGDWMVRRGLVTPPRLRAFADEAHLDGVQKSRVAADLVRTGSESVPESVTRFHVLAHGLPEPTINMNILSDRGELLGRGDLPFPPWKVLAEYDGWYHERSAAQRQRDILRRERLEAAGWLVVVLTSEDLKNPRRAVWRVFNALRSRGYAGPPPRLDPRFGRWMPISTR